MMTLRPSLGDDFGHGFEIEAPFGDLGCLRILGIEGIEAGGVTLGLIDPLNGIALGVLDSSFGLTTGLRDSAVVEGAGLVNRSFAVLLGLIDFVEGGLDRSRRVHVLELDLEDLQSHLEFAGEFLELLQGLVLNVPGARS